MNERERAYRRILLIFGFCFLIFVGLCIRLLMIQIVNYPKYSELAAVQRQSSLAINPLRGSFFDRHGRIIRGTTEAWFLLFEKMDSWQFQQLAIELGPVLAADLSPYYQKQRGKQLWIYPVPLNERQITQIREMKLPGLKIVSNLIRKDRIPGLAWHLLGFVDGGHGFSGLEYLYQPFLDHQNKFASIFSLTDGQRNYLPGLGLHSQSQMNHSGVVLTIDVKIQEIVDQVMDAHGLTGAIVILDSKTGEILAMSSRPMVDFTDPGNNSAAEHPFVNRAIAAYQPGSIFKLVTLSVGLDSGWLSGDESFDALGYYQIGSKKWLSPIPKNEHGQISLSEAFAYSYNPAFIEIALQLQPQLILKYADKFGLGQPCNIGLLDEAWGELPSGIGLSEGEIANMAMGQQNVYATPLQIASVVQTIANDGVRCIPRLVLGSIQGNEKAVSILEKPQPIRVIKSETAHKVKDMMAAVVAYGTGTAAQLDNGAAGKTGTAQVGDDPQVLPHAWFAGYTPLDTPKYVMVVFCEKGKSGAETAAPIFKEVMEKVTRIRD
jgi:cell division protein FtsI/penicillin-binding protein 2